EAGLPVPPDYITGNSYQLDEVAVDLKILMSLPVPPTALFVCNDNVGMSALKAARDMGISVPEQLSLVGFDDAPLSGLSIPGLTTIHHPMHEVGAKATQLLLERIEGNTEIPDSYLFTPELIVRGSTAPPMK